MSDLLQHTARGLYCPAGGFYIDPLRPVDRAVVTHAHADHARWGCCHYLASEPSRHLLRMRLGPSVDLQCLPFGKTITVGGVHLSMHPAGHMLGSAQIRLEYRGRVAVVTGDYKLGREDATCLPWEPLRCHLFVTESTFGLPIYRWPPQQAIFAAINAWWRDCRQEGTCCLLYGYAVGKSQRLLSGLDPTIGPIYTHGAVEKGTGAYRQTGVSLPPTIAVNTLDDRHDYRGSLVVAVPGAHGTPWMRRFGTVRTAMASGWMTVRGARRRRGVDRGFVLSDHVDWPGLLEAVRLTDPEETWVTHGSAAVVARHLNEIGYPAQALTGLHRAGGEDEDAADASSAEAAAYEASSPPS